MVTELKALDNTELLKLKQVRCDLYEYIKRERYKGYDPYDGLNSKVLESICLKKSSIIRLLWIQFFKKSPINFRRIFLVDKGFNPKAGALFLSANIRRVRLTGDNKWEKECFYLFDMIKKSRIDSRHGSSWGYNFSWQAKAFYVPVGVPNIVTTVYVGNALIDFHNTFKIQQAKEYIEDIKNFVLSEMIIRDNGGNMCFRYVPGKDVKVHNANLLTAAFLSRINSNQRNTELWKVIQNTVDFSLRDIRDHGYWPYGHDEGFRWMDNFHTAFNLEALLEIRRSAFTAQYDSIIKKELNYYLTNMFLKNGIPKYYNNRLYPIDVHTIAQAIIILSRAIQDDSDLFNPREKEFMKLLAGAVVRFAIDKLWSGKGYFYYVINKHYINRVPYMRWSQAWMFYALCWVLDGVNERNEDRPRV